MKRYCLTLDLKDDAASISTYEKHHRNVWPEVKQSLSDSGIESMEIFRASNRLFMIIEVNDKFSFDRKAKLDHENLKVQEWEALMSQYQQQLSFAKPGEKWVLMDRIFEFSR